MSNVIVRRSEKRFRFLDWEGLKEFKRKCDEAYAKSGSLSFKGTVLNIASLPNVSTCDVGDMYNITHGGKTTSDFVEGPGKTLQDGENVVAINTAGSGETPVMKWDILGGVLDVSDKLTFGSVMPSNPSDGDTFLYLGDTTYIYNEITNVDPGDNPSALGWYEYDDSTQQYILSEDTSVDPQKTYYIKTEQYVKGVIYVYDNTEHSWIAQSSGDTFVPITTSYINSLFD
jgi:hypothetical protein